MGTDDCWQHKCQQTVPDVGDYLTENFQKELFGNELGFKKNMCEDLMKQMIENGRSYIQLFCEEGFFVIGVNDILGTVYWQFTSKEKMDKILSLVLFAFLWPF